MIIPSASLTALFLLCAPDVSPVTLNAVIQTESGGNPYQVANVSDGISRSFNDIDDAIKYLDELTKANKRFSAGLMQIYSGNFTALGLNNKTVFNPCENIKGGAHILKENYERQTGNDEQVNLLKSLSMFYSGNDKTGFKKEKQFRNTSYVERVSKHAYAVPAIELNGKSQALPEQTQSTEIETEKSNLTQKESPQEWDVFGDFKK
ncbi:lytic transglycosylase domain-containing protein [Escherichia coli]|nr:lytic transglycosylase domain-containing protein [Escherichia coli]